MSSHHIAQREHALCNSQCPCGHSRWTIGTHPGCLVRCLVIIFFTCAILHIHVVSVKEMRQMEKKQSRRILHSKLNKSPGNENWTVGLKKKRKRKPVWNTTTHTSLWHLWVCTYWAMVTPEDIQLWVVGCVCLQAPPSSSSLYCPCRLYWQASDSWGRKHETTSCFPLKKWSTPLPTTRWAAARCTSHVVRSCTRPNGSPLLRRNNINLTSGWCQL